MDQRELSKIQDKTAAAAGQRARLTEEARGLLVEGMAPRPYLDALIERGLHVDAVRFLTSALPKREAVWWACLCAAEVLGPEPPPAVAAALEAARAWVIDPNDEKRRAAFPAAEAAEMGTPAGCAAAAAYFSGGSLAPVNLPEVPPPEHITADLAGTSVVLAAVSKQPEKAPEKYAAFLRIGLEVASGQHAWPEAPRETTADRKAGDVKTQGHSKAPDPKGQGPSKAPDAKTEGPPKAHDAKTERERRLAELQARRARQ